MNRHARNARARLPMLRMLPMLALLGTVLATGCGDDAPTDVVVTIDAESTWRASDTTLRVIVRGAPEGDAPFEAPARDVSLVVGTGQSYAWPVSVTVAPKGGANSRRWSVEAIATTPTNEVATVRVRGSYVSGRTLRVSLLLENTCEGVVCAADLTCQGGVCVDATLVTAVDGGVDELDASSEGGIPEYCPAETVRTPDPTAGTLDIGGVAPSYPVTETCPNAHTLGQACPSTASTEDFCFSGRAQGGAAFCRTPCSFTEADGGVRNDDPTCTAIHPDSHCLPEVGYGSEPDRFLCSFPCNPFDGVGCPATLDCGTVADSEHSTFVPTCLALDANPGHSLEPCAVSGGETSPTITGCDVGYTCGFGDICGGPETGYICQQICDPDPFAPRVECPAGHACYRLAGGSYRDAIGPITLGRCFPQ